VNVEDGALTSCNVNEEQVQATIEVGETFIADLVMKLICKKLLK
jgi:hypothetical protein